ncbi:hypothetical protein JL720_16222 [Aureococcus anophagefferens]|nr:hypothetical protein JL720_16222 [Aureococcus anophagefferens]
MRRARRSTSVYEVAKKCAVVRAEAAMDSPVRCELGRGAAVMMSKRVTVMTADGKSVDRCLLTRPVEGWTSFKCLAASAQKPPPDPKAYDGRIGDPSGEADGAERAARRGARGAARGRRRAGLLGQLHELVADHTALWVPKTVEDALAMLIRAQTAKVCQAFGEPPDPQHPVYRPRVERFYGDGSRNPFPGLVGMQVSIPKARPTLFVYSRMDSVILPEHVEEYVATYDAADVSTLEFATVPHIGGMRVRRTSTTAASAATRAFPRATGGSDHGAIARQVERQVHRAE